MKAFILAAGLGTRLKPWTLEHPKALVPVGGVPMLERVIRRLVGEGFNSITINVHHFSEQIISFVSNNNFGADIRISDESGLLLDTGGGLLHASELLFQDSEPVLIHNVDILSNADLSHLMRVHKDGDAAATLLSSNRNSSRKLVVDSDGYLCGWHNLKNDEYRPSGFSPSEGMHEVAFSGIHIVGPKIIERMKSNGWNGVFPIMDFYLKECDTMHIKCLECDSLELIDIGKPDTLAQADEFLNRLR